MQWNGEGEARNACVQVGDNHVKGKRGRNRKGEGLWESQANVID